MKDKKKILLIILSVGAVISLLYGITTTPHRKYSVPETQATQHESVAVKNIVPTERRAKKTNFTIWDRNPFIPKGTKAEVRVVLDGIMWNEVNPKVMINNEILGIGSTIAGYKVIDVKKDRVIVNDGTEDIVLRLD